MKKAADGWRSVSGEAIATKTMPLWFYCTIKGPEKQG